MLRRGRFPCYRSVPFVNMQELFYSMGLFVFWTNMSVLPLPPPPVNLYRSSASHLTARFSLTHLILNAQLNNSENLQIADDDFQETHDEILVRFYNFFEGL